MHRFTHDWEREASLRLRAGDTTVIPEYEDRGRLHEGTLEQMQAAAMRAYLADTLDGKDALLIVGTNDDAAQLSSEIRSQMIEYGLVEPVPIARLGMRAGLTPRECRGSGAGPAGGPQHPGRRRAAGRQPRHLHGAGPGRRTGRCGCAAPTAGSRTCPARYVDEHLTLAYASTVHAAQGRTVDTCHALLDEAAAREAAYVALSRGREANYAYLVAAARAGRASARAAGRHRRRAPRPGCWATSRPGPAPPSSSASAPGTGRRWPGSAPSGTRSPETPPAPATPRSSLACSAPPGRRR